MTSEEEDQLWQETRDAAYIEAATRTEKGEMIMGDKTRGLVRKFHVSRTDGKSANGQKHEACEYFVLDLMHDKHAAPALRAYAESARQDGYELLAIDLETEAVKLDQHST